MDIKALLSQAQKAQGALAAKISEFEKKVFEFNYKNGSVIIQMSGAGNIRKLTINPILVDPEDKDMLEQMVAEAVNSAHKTIQNKRDEIQQSAMPKGIGF